MPYRSGGNPKRRKLNTAQDDSSTSRNPDNGESWKCWILTHKECIVEDIMLLLVLDKKFWLTVLTKVGLIILVWFFWSSDDSLLYQWIRVCTSCLSMNLADPSNMPWLMGKTDIPLSSVSHFTDHLIRHPYPNLSQPPQLAYSRGSSQSSLCDILAPDLSMRAGDGSSSANSSRAQSSVSGSLTVGESVYSVQLRN